MVHMKSFFFGVVVTRVLCVHVSFRIFTLPYRSCSQTKRGRGNTPLVTHLRHHVTTRIFLGADNNMLCELYPL